MFKNNELYICYASSDEFASHTGISILSLLENNKECYITKIFIIDYGISKINRKYIKNTIEKYNRSVEFINAKEKLKNIKSQIREISDYNGSIATYSRAFIDFIVPKYVNKLLYIDSDTIIREGLQYLNNYCLEKYVMAAVIGANQYPYPNELENIELNLQNGNKIYFACGVILYNLKNWREYDCNKSIIEIINKNKNYLYADQTIINNSIPNNLVLKLPPKYNYWGHIFPKAREKYELKRGGWWSDKEIQEAINEPVIIHYKGLVVRPWYSDSISRKKDMYIMYKNKSFWKSIKNISLNDYIKNNHLSKEERYSIIKVKLQMKIPYNWMLKLIKYLINYFKKKN